MENKTLVTRGGGSELQHLLILVSLFKLIIVQYAACLICNHRSTAQRHMGVGVGGEKSEH